MPSIACQCNQCKKYSVASLGVEGLALCPNCSVKWGKVNSGKVFESCFICSCRHFYRHKDFNQAIGCLVMLIGIVLVPFTYGLSLPVLALFDWLLYRKTQDVVLCYRCGAEFRGFIIPNHINTFEHHLGDKYQEKEGDSGSLTS